MSIKIAECYFNRQLRRKENFQIEPVPIVYLRLSGKTQERHRSTDTEVLERKQDKTYIMERKVKRIRQVQ